MKSQTAIQRAKLRDPMGSHICPWQRTQNQHQMESSFSLKPVQTGLGFLFSLLSSSSLEDDWPREDEVATGLKSYTVLHCIDYLHAFCLGSFVMFILIMFCASFAVCIEVCLKHCFGLPLWAKKDSYTTSYLLRAKYKVTVN